jgi:hypothetical protein
MLVTKMSAEAHAACGSSSAARSARRRQPFRIGFVYDQEVLLTFNARPG